MNEPTTYQIVIRGHPGERMLSRLRDDFTIDHLDPVDTRLTGVIRDAAQLHGVLTHLTSLAIEVVSVTPTDQSTTDPSPTQTNHRKAAQ